MFTNTLKDSEIKAEEYNVARTTFPYESIVSRIGKNYEVHELLPFRNEEYKIFDNQNKIISFVSKKRFMEKY